MGRNAAQIYSGRTNFSGDVHNSDNRMIAVIYVSSAAHRMTDAELESILAESRRNNGRDGITGMLLYSDGNFIQALEGPDAAIDAVLARIAQDPRHEGIITVARYVIGQPQFPSWSMGFRPIEHREMTELRGAFTALDRPLFKPNSPEAGSIAHRLLERFRDTNPN